MGVNRIGPYELRGELGRGAMAVVWRAWDTRIGREVAIKEPLLPAGLSDEARADFAQRFIREAQTAGRLSHPGVVTIYATEIVDEHAFIVMELIDGRTLGETIERGPIEPAFAMSILDQLLDAVAYAHARQVVHRDIKPDNIFVTADGRVKLTDFGIARLGGSATLTQAGTVMGTPGYMAPEQVRGEVVDERADIFALGAVAHELFTGRNPFGVTEDESPTTIMYRVVHESQPSLRVSGFEAPEWLEAIVACALAKDPNTRYASAEQMRRDLDRRVASVALPRKRAVMWRERMPLIIGCALAAITATVIVAQLLGRPAPPVPAQANATTAAATSTASPAPTPEAEPATDMDQLRGEAEQVVRDFFAAQNANRVSEAYALLSNAQHDEYGETAFADGQDGAITYWGNEYQGDLRGVEVGRLTATRAEVTAECGFLRSDGTATHVDGANIVLVREDDTWRIDSFETIFPRGEG